jgi:hypothetical protein
MKIARLATLATLASLCIGMAIGAPTHKKAAPKGVMCPVCSMPLSAKKTAVDPVAVRLKKGGKVMYCCAGCKMPASVLVASKPPKHKKGK